LIKLDSLKVQGNSSQGNESADLPNHSGNITHIVWNDKYRKLTTCDSTGTIIVFMKHNGQWVEEMVNNRKSSVVKDMKWSPDGTKICIAYEDGNVIVGGVEGNRKWGKEYQIQI
jgi:WD repeat-containing protein 35